MASTSMMNIISSLWEKPAMHHMGAVVVFCITFLAARWYLSHRRLPPGPPALPLIGSLPWMRGDLRDTLLKLVPRYGSVFTIYVGSMPAVVVADPQLIREALLKHGPALLDRPPDSLVKFSRRDKIRTALAMGTEPKPDEKDKKGVLEAGGEVWQQQRTFVHNAFRQFGIGTADYEPQILEESKHVIDLLLHEAESGPLDPHWLIMKAVANIIHSVLYGYRREYDDPKYVRYLESTEEGFKILGTVGPTMIFPFLKYVPGDPFGWDRFMDFVCQQVGDLREAVDEAKENREPGVPRSFIDAYLDQVEKTKGDPNTSFDEERLVSTIGNLFGGGSETTTTTLLWGIIYLLHHPDVHQKVKDEVDNVIGSERQPSMKDKLNLPYTEACLLEIQRMADILPLNAPRFTTQDVQLGGQIIPEATTVLLLFHAIHRDPDVWSDPYVFRPERFLDEDGKVFGRDRIIPFSLGKRNCVGESLAKMELFLFFTSFIQQLDISLPDGAALPELTGKLGLTYMPKRFEVCIKSRR